MFKHPISVSLSGADRLMNLLQAFERHENLQGAHAVQGNLMESLLHANNLIGPNKKPVLLPTLF